MHLHVKLIRLNMENKGIHEDNLFHQRKYVGTFSFIFTMSPQMLQKKTLPLAATHHASFATYQRSFWYANKGTSRKLTTLPLATTSALLYRTSH